MSVCALKDFMGSTGEQLTAKVRRALELAVELLQFEWYLRPPAATALEFKLFTSTDQEEQEEEEEEEQQEEEEEEQQVVIEEKKKKKEKDKYNRA
jgi:hypothetical protein